MIKKILHSSEQHVNQPYLEKYTVQVPDSVIDALVKHLHQFKSSNCSSLDVLAQQYPITEIKQRVLQNKQTLIDDFSASIVHQLCHQSGYMCVSNFPVNHSDEDIGLLLFILSCYMGDPTYNNRDKKFIWPVISQQIESTKTLEGNIRYGNTGEALPFHTDTGTFAGLLCINSASTGGENTLISTVAIHNQILDADPLLLSILYEDFYIDRRGEEMIGEHPYASLPVFGMSKQDQLKTFWSHYYNYDAYTKYPIPPLSPKQEAAYALLQHHIQQVYDEKNVTIKADPGDLLLMNNNLIMHNRKPFASLHTHQRKLFRIWINNSQYESFPHMFGYL